MTFDDLPVIVQLPAPLHDEVVAWVEHDVGWQVVGPESLLPAVLALSDRPVDAPAWVAVTGGPVTAEVVRRHLTAGALDVVGWPHERHRLPAIAARATTRRTNGARTPTWTVAGVAGGVGTSTVALAIGGLLAWSGASVLVVGAVDLARLACGTGSRTDDADDGARIPVVGVPGLSIAVRRTAAEATPWRGDVVVVDGGTRSPAAADLLIARPDGALRQATALRRPVAVVGSGPLGAAAVRRVLGGAPHLWLAWSARVARAGVLGRVPHALPGAWLRTLREGIARLGPTT